MPPFKVVSDFNPTGDQPQAIAKLVDGLRADMRHQVLLGVTGSGKSLGYLDFIFVVEKHGETVRRRVIPIGPWIDSVMASRVAREDGDTEITDLDLGGGDVEYHVQSFDPVSGAVTLRPVSAVLRHRPPERMYRLRTACGREATMTGDHNLWVLRDGALQLIRTEEALETDYIPLPGQLVTGGELAKLDMVEALSSVPRNLFVQAHDPVLAYLREGGKDTISEVLTADGVNPYGKLYAIRHGLRGRGIRATTFRKLLAATDSLGGHWYGAGALITARTERNALPAHLELTPALMRLLGTYIAEGNAQQGYIVVANHHTSVRREFELSLKELGLSFSVRQSSDYQISSTPLAAWLCDECGHSAHYKHLPSFWPDLSKPLLAHMLRAYFDGDGSVERNGEVIATTASRQLASDLCYALLSFGIWARIRRTWKKASNAHHAGDWYSAVVISGVDNLKRFGEDIGFSIARKSQRLNVLTQRTGNSNVDVVPINGAELRKLREQAGLSAAALGRLSDLSRPAIHMIEGGQRRPQSTSLCRILAALEVVAHSTHVPPEWWELWSSLQALCRLRWTPVAAVEPADYEHEYVYDVSVPGPETFLAGTGGFFVHNTYTMAKVVEEVQKPTLILAHNKTLAAQLYSEMREFFPSNAVEYFVSYYDYYQPEAYIPRTDTFIEKDSQINEEIDRLRLATTSSLFSRRDTLIVASVSCIYGLGSPQDYGQGVLRLKVGEMVRRNGILRHLIEIYYDRNDNFLQRGRFRVRGDVLEIQPADREFAYRVSLFGDEIERISEIDTLTGEVLADHDEIQVFPAKHFVTPQDRLNEALDDIEQELQEQVASFESQGKLLEAQRIKQRVNYDLEMMREVGFCSGIENYSRPLAQRPPGSTPWTLLDYFPADWLLIVDESHMSLPQVRGMYNGDRARKEVLVDYGFRLPSALDNRPLRFDEFEEHIHQAIFVSATPGPYEFQHGEQVVEQVIRPTGLVDPVVVVRPTTGQIDDLMREIRTRVAKGQRALVTTLTKRMAEDLTEYLAELNIKVHYLHSDIHTIERVEILRDLRLGVYDVVVGINLLREGLDLPEVSLVAVLDADKEGFLRSGSALIQTIGRAARHVEGTAVLYADRMTDSMQTAIDETNRRREIQMRFNQEHDITPQSIVKSIRDLTDRVKVMAESKAEYGAGEEPATVDAADLSRDELARLIKQIEKEMKDAAKALEFEKAAALRDQLVELRGLELVGKVGAA